MASKQDPIVRKTTIPSDKFDRTSLQKNGNADTKAGVTTTTTALLDGDDSQDANESGVRKADRNLKAAIWTIVCGVALPCIPVIIISGILLYIILSKRVHPTPGWPELELHLPGAQPRSKGVIDMIDYFRHNAGSAYYVNENPSTITTVASWTSRVIPYLTSSIMALVAFFAARRIVTKSKKGSGSDLPTPEQLTLLIDLLGGKGFEPLKDTILHRWAHKRKLVDPIPLAFGALFAITTLGLIIPLVDTWFGIATTSIKPTNLLRLSLENIEGDVSFYSSRVLRSDLCPSGPGAYSTGDNALWTSCNLNSDDPSATEGISFDLVGSDEDIRALEGAPTANSTISTYPTDHITGSGAEAFYYLANPYTATQSLDVDFKAVTYAVSTQCAPITQQCLPNVEWPVDSSGVFQCTAGFGANFTFDGGSQTLDATSADGGSNPAGDKPLVGVAFSTDAQLSERVGRYTPNLRQTSNGGNQSVASGTNASYQYLQPSNPLHFAAWAVGYPSFGQAQAKSDSIWAVSNPLLNDSQIYRSQGGATEWILSCSTTVYDVSYTWVNGSVRDFIKELASPEMAALSAPFAISGLRERYVALSSVAAAAGASDDSGALAAMFADRWSQTALALSAGVMSREPNLLTQVRSISRQLARVPLLPLYILLALKAIYVLAVIALAMGAYCFTHPAETEIVKTQLSTRGLAAAHFDTPDILQSKVVSQLSERLLPATVTAKNDPTEPDDPAKGGLKRAATFLGDLPDKRIGVVAHADGVWRFAVVANGAWNGIKPLAVDLVDMEAKAGNLGTAGDLVKAWIK